MRLARIKPWLWNLSIVGLIAADMFALWVWAMRPPRIFSYLLGLVGTTEEAPIPRLVGWARGDDGPRTPSGVVSLFETGDLFFASVLLLTLIFLVVVLLAARRSEGSLWRRLTAPLSLAGAVALRFRVRTALAIIAILGLYLGWEINAWRTWTLRSSYLKKAADAAALEGNQQAMLQFHLEQRARRVKLESSPPADQSIPGFGYYRSKDSVAAERLADKEESERAVKDTSALIAAIAARKRKYQRAAADPWRPLPADEPLPKGDFTALDWLIRRDYPRALAAYDELARAYPNLVEAYLEPAWIRAACPDAQYRDGKLAVAFATRACELTDWRDEGTLSAMAAASAEAGDFAAAVKWQQKVASLVGAPDKLCQERLDLYAAGKPYRQK